MRKGSNWGRNWKKKTTLLTFGNLRAGDRCGGLMKTTKKESIRDKSVAAQDFVRHDAQNYPFPEFHLRQKRRGAGPCSPRRP